MSMINKIEAEAELLDDNELDYAQWLVDDDDGITLDEAIEMIEQCIRQRQERQGG